MSLITKSTSVCFFIKTFLIRHHVFFQKNLYELNFLLDWDC